MQSTIWGGGYRRNTLDVCNSSSNWYKFGIFAVTVTMVSRYHGNLKFRYLRGNFLDGNGIIYFDLNRNGIMQLLW